MFGHGGRGDTFLASMEGTSVTILKYLLFTFTYFEGKPSHCVHVYSGCETVLFSDEHLSSNVRNLKLPL